MGAAEAGSWGGGGGTGGISTGVFGACGGPSRAEVGGPGMVAVLEEGLAGLDWAGAEVSKGFKGRREKIGEGGQDKIRVRREERIPADPGFLHIFISPRKQLISHLKHVGILNAKQRLVRLVSFRHTQILAVICSGETNGSRVYLGRRWAGPGSAQRWARPRCRCRCSLGCCCDYC